MRWRLSHLIYVMVENVKDSVSESVKVSVPISVSFQNFNFVVAAFSESICIVTLKGIEYAVRPIDHGFSTVLKALDIRIRSGHYPMR